RFEIEVEAHERSHGERIGGAPGDAALRVEPFEIADEQQPEVATGRQTRSPHHGRVEPLTLLLSESIEARRVEDRVQPGVKRMPRRDRQLGGSHKHRSLLARAFAHRHASHCTITPPVVPKEGLCACQANIDLTIDVPPLFGQAEAPHQLFEGASVLWSVLEPREEIEWFTQVATVMQTPRDGRQVLETDTDMPRSVLEDGTSFVLRQRPPRVRFADRNHGSPCRIRTAEYRRD